jgi:hypothetical protein
MALGEPLLLGGTVPDSRSGWWRVSVSSCTELKMPRSNSSGHCIYVGKTSRITTGYTDREVNLI